MHVPVRPLAVVAALALCAVAWPAGAQVLSPPLSSLHGKPAAETKPSEKAKPGQAGTKAKSTDKASAKSGSQPGTKATRTSAAAKPGSVAPSGRAWEDLPMPKPKVKPEDAVLEMPRQGARPVVGNGGGGMAIGF